MILEWRVEAHEGKTQQQLNDDYATVVETYKPGASGSGKNNKSKSRKNAKPSNSLTATANSGFSPIDGDCSGGQCDAPERKQIRLQKSRRRVVTERSTLLVAEESSLRVLCRATRLKEYMISEADSSQQILVSDTSNDQTLLTSVWRVLERTGRKVMMTGAFVGRNVAEVFPVVSAVAKIVCEDGNSFAAYAHEALLDSNPAQKDSLLSVHQSLRDQRNDIDDLARCERNVHGKPGMQMARFGKWRLVPFFFDGTKCSFYKVQPITEAEEHELPKIVLTDGSVPYEPMARLHSRR